MQHFWPVLWLPRLLSLSAGVDAAPPPALALCVSHETERYRVSMGILGRIAEVQLRIVPEPPAPSQPVEPFPRVLRAVAQGSGSVMGFGKGDQQIESEFDVRQRRAQRWKNVRNNGERVTTDTAEQSQPGTVSLLRQRSNEADRAESFTRAAPILDPVGFLLHLRTALPTTPTSYEVLDGRALWLASLSGTRADPDAPDMWRIDGKLDPIFWNGNPDGERSSYKLTMFFTRDRFHTLARLVVPFGVGDVRAELVQLERTATNASDLARTLYCRGPVRGSPWTTIAAIVKAMQRQPASRASP